MKESRATVKGLPFLLASNPVNLAEIWYGSDGMKRLALAALLVFGLVPVNVALAASAGIKAANDCYDQFRTGNMKAAVKFCTEAIESGDLEKADLVGALINRGVAFRNLGEYKRAIVDYTEALKGAPDDPLIYANRANARRELGELKHAYDDANKAISLDGKRAASWYTRGAVLEKAGQLKNAHADYMHALKLDPENEEYKNQLALLNARLAQGG
jgi:tetratricopeptide (TPR) repeat protein